MKYLETDGANTACLADAARGKMSDLAQMAHHLAHCQQSQLGDQHLGRPII